MSEVVSLTESEPCPRCQQQIEINQKYVHLIKLLKRKTQKNQHSKYKDSYCHSIIEATSLQNPTTFQASCRSQKPTHPQVLPLQQLDQPSCLEKKATLMAFRTINAKLNKILYKNGFSMIARKVQHSSQQKHSLLKNTKNQQKISSFDSECSSLLQKNLHKKIFNLQLENKVLTSENAKLRQEIYETERRQEKQIFKKKESLEMFAQQLNQKLELIQDLKSSIMTLESQIAKQKANKTNSDLMLEEDPMVLKKTVSRLQNINDKLNSEITNLKCQKKERGQDIQELKGEIGGLNQKIIHLKQQNFELNFSRGKQQSMKKQIETFNSRIAAKIDKVKKVQKKYNELFRNIPSNTYVDSPSYFKSSERKMVGATETTENFLQRSSSIRQIETESKLESIFNYLFNIESDDYELHNTEFFDEQQRMLLLSHKEKYLQTMRQGCIGGDTKVNIVAQSNSRKYDEIEFFNNEIGDSVINMLNQNNNLHPEVEVRQLKLKAVEDDSQKLKFIEKISDLKNTQLHLRNVILNLLKSLEIKSVKKESQAILGIIFDIFEYSQTEKQVMFPVKKKLFGFI